MSSALLAAAPAAAVPAPQAAEPAAAVPVRFFVDADADPGLLPRLLAPFARRDLTPDRMWSHRNGGTMHVEIALDAMPAHELHLVEGNLRQVVGLQRLSRQEGTLLARAA